MNNMKGWINFSQIWNIDDSLLPWRKRWFVRCMRYAMILVESFTKNNLVNYASALTYSTMMAAVPALAIVFAVARGFGFGYLIEENIRQSMQMSSEITEHLLVFINSYLENTQSGIFIGVGLLMLLYVIVNLTSNIEVAFNNIWHVENSRNVYRRFTNYISVFFLLPIILIVSSGISIFLMTLESLFPDLILLSSSIKWLLKISPLLLIILSFALMNKFMPNTHVSWKYVWFPSILSGVAFYLVQTFYFFYQLRLSSYNAIYGSFAAIPLFMLWLQISWTICLIGGRMCYASQHLQDYMYSRTSSILSRRYKDVFSLVLMKHICKRFAQGTSPYTPYTLAEETQLPLHMVRILLAEMVQAKLLVSFRDEHGVHTQYLPAMDINYLTIKKVISQLDVRGSEQLPLKWLPKSKEWERLLEQRMQNQEIKLVDL